MCRQAVSIQDGHQMVTAVCVSIQYVWGRLGGRRFKNNEPMRGSTCIEKRGVAGSRPNTSQENILLYVKKRLRVVNLN
jgi:hypothetical protein